MSSKAKEQAKSPDKKPEVTSIRSLQAILAKLEARARDAKQHQKEIEKLEAELYDELPPDQGANFDKSKLRNMEAVHKKNRGTPSPELVRKAELRLIEKEQLGLFDAYPVRPGNEFPTLLARLPIFPAVARSRQKKFLDTDNALPFETPFGKGRRHGPPVSVEDEDYLIALIRLRKKCLIGQGGKFPVPLGSTHFQDQEGKTSVHIVCCTLSQILQEMKITDAGKNFRQALTSVKRLASMVIELETKKSDRYFGKSVKGTSFKLVDVIWDAYESQGLIIAQFPPVVVNWLENHASFIQWDVRRKLAGRNARAVHRFLSTQPRQYDAPMIWLANTIGWEGDKRRMRSAFESALTQLISLKWLQGYEVSGTGRKIPYRIHIWR